MYKYARPNVTPRTGYVYTDPDTGCRFDETLHQALVDAVVRHRKANGLPLAPNLSEIIEDDICRRNPAAFRVDRPPVAAVLPTPPSPRRGTVSLSDAISRTLRVLRARTGQKVLSTVVRDRGAICRACEHNVGEPCCYSCKVESVFSPIVGKKHRNLSTVLVGVCTVDNTFTKAVVWIPSSTAYEDEYPESCWKRKKEVEHGT